MIFTKRSKKEVNYNGPIFKKQWLKEFEKQIISYKNTPFSLGYDICFLSNFRHISDEARVTSEVLKHHLGFTFKGQGFASSYKKHQVYCIAIVDGKGDMDLIRFIEVLVHEASHVVDYIIENCAIQNVDTEVRAYLLDHIVGLCMKQVKIQLKGE